MNVIVRLLMCLVIPTLPMAPSVSAEVSRRDVEVPSRQGHPQVVITPARREAVVDAIARRLVSQGWSVTKTTPYGIEMEQPAKGAAGFFGSMLSVNKFVTDPVYRLTFGLADAGHGGVSLTAAQALVQNPHTGTESPVRLDRKKHEAQLWDLLQSLKIDIEANAKEESAEAAAASVVPEFPVGFAWPNRPTSGQVARDSVFGLISYYDRFDDLRHITTDSAAVVLAEPLETGSLFLMGHAQCRGDSVGPLIASDLQLLSTGDAARAAEGASGLVILADDRRFVFDSLQHRELVGGVHLVVIPVQRDTLLVLSGSRLVEGRLGSTDFRLTPRGYEGFQALARLLSRDAARRRSAVRGGSSVRGRPAK